MRSVSVYLAGPGTEAGLLWTQRRQLPDLMGRVGRERNLPVIRKDRVRTQGLCCAFSEHHQTGLKDCHDLDNLMLRHDIEGYCAALPWDSGPRLLLALQCPSSLNGHPESLSLPFVHILLILQCPLTTASSRRPARITQT